MTYNPVPDPAKLARGLLGTTGYYSGYLVPNHDEAYAAYEPPIVDPYRGFTIAAGSTNAPVLIWRLRGNRDLLGVRTRVRAATTGGAASMSFFVGGQSATIAPSGVEAWYTANVTPLQGGVVECGLYATTGGGVTIDFVKAQSRLVGAAPAAGTRPSGFVRQYSGHYDANAGVASEHVSRYMAGPTYIANDRPICVFHHLAQPVVTGAKSNAFWQSFNSTGQDLVGRGSLPYCEDSNRHYILDAYSVQSAGAGEFTISIGAWSQTFSPSSLTAWSSAVLELPPGPHDVRCSVKPGAANQLRVATVQIWRAEA